VDAATFVEVGVQAFERRDDIWTAA
jgi:hypothetical protein